MLNWAPETHHPPRSPARSYYDQRLYSPAGILTAGPDHRRHSQLQRHQHPQTGHVYQLNEMPSSVPQNQPHPPHPHPPSGLYATDHTAGQQARPPQAPSTILLRNSEMLDHAQGHHPVYAPRLHSVSGDQPPAFIHGQHRPSIDMYPAPRFTEYHFNPPVTTNGRPPGSNSPMVSPTEPRPDTMRIADILTTGERSDSRTSVDNRSADNRFELQIRQQPIAARSCGFGERDRRVIDPPPIVQLLIKDASLTQEETAKHLRYPHYVMSCSIFDETGSCDASFMPEEYRQQRRLMGLLVSAPFVGKDEHGEEGCFFCFPDLSCRTPGSFRLHFTLVKIDPIRAKEVKRFPTLVTAHSDVFTVYTAKDFPGMQASTKLTKRLKEQGCIISIKKGNDRSKNTRSHDDSSDGEQDEGETTLQGKRRRRSTRQ
ncbi:sexual development regulator velC [Fusarium bulbicola]|nr:sexual development regulator velC [Fusarium bulbicola]